LAVALNKVVEGYALMSVLNTTEVETEVPEPVIELDAIEPEWENGCSAEFEPQDREGDIRSQLRLEYLNSEERKSLIAACSDFADIFYLPGDKLTSTGAAQHSISEKASAKVVAGRDNRGEQFTLE
jgi:hypothetical protein